MEEGVEVYKCANPRCDNEIRFTKEMEERFRKLGFTDDKTPTGNVTKPRYCRSCKEARRASQGNR